MQGFCDGTYVAENHIDNEATDGPRNLVWEW